MLRGLSQRIKRGATPCSHAHRKATPASMKRPANRNAQAVCSAKSTAHLVAPLACTPQHCFYATTPSCTPQLCRVYVLWPGRPVCRPVGRSACQLRNSSCSCSQPTVLVGNTCPGPLLRLIQRPQRRFNGVYAKTLPSSPKLWRVRQSSVVCAETLWSTPQRPDKPACRHVCRSVFRPSNRQAGLT